MVSTLVSTLTEYPTLLILVVGVRDGRRAVGHLETVRGGGMAQPKSQVSCRRLFSRPFFSGSLSRVPV